MLDYKRIVLLFTVVIFSSYFIFIFLNLEMLSKYVLLFASYYIEVDPYKEFAIGIFTFVVLSLISFTFLRPYALFWLIKGFLTLFVLIWRESARAFDSATYYGFGVYDLDRYIFGSGGTANVMHINHYFSYLVGNSYYSLKIFNSFIGFLGIILFYKAFVYIMKKSNLKNMEPFKYWVFLLPSVLLWTSSLGKDALIFFCVGLFTFGAVHLIDKMNPKYFFIIFLAMFLSLYVRPWYPMIMIMALSLYYTNFRSFRSIFLLIFFSPLLYIILISMLQLFGIGSFDDIFERMTSLSIGFSRGGSAIGVNKITGLSSYIFYFIPNAFTALFRPVIFEVRNLGMLLSSLENLLILIFFIKYLLGNFLKLMQNKYLKFLILFLFAWLLLYVIPQGNLGTTVRFKVHILPVILIIIYMSRELQRNKSRIKDQ
jgi:hypothetical protein